MREDATEIEIRSELAREERLQVMLHDTSWQQIRMAASQFSCARS